MKLNPKVYSNIMTSLREHKYAGKPVGIYLVRLNNETGNEFRKVVLQ